MRSKRMLVATSGENSPVLKKIFKVQTFYSGDENLQFIGSTDNDLSIKTLTYQEMKMPA